MCKVVVASTLENLFIKGLKKSLKNFDEKEKKKNTIVTMIIQEFPRKLSRSILK